MLAINIIIYELTPQYTSYSSQHYQVTFPFIMLAINIIIYELTPLYTSYGSQHYQVTFPFILIAIYVIIYELTPQYTSYGSQHYQVTFPFISLPPGEFFMFFVVCCFFQNQLFRKIISRITIRVSNSLDPDQAGHFVGPDFGPNCLQKLTADNTRR